jgi:hypothetical protein
MKKILTLSILTLSISSFAQVDYSACQEPFSSYGIDPEGNITDYQGKELVKKEVKDGVESYVIKGGGYGGMGMNHDKTIHISRDEKGNIQSIVEGVQEVSKSELEKLKEAQLNMQVNMAKPGLGGQYGMGYGFGYNGELNEQNALGYNISKEDLKDLKKNWRKDKKLTRKVRRIIKKMQDSGKARFHIGSESKFVVNGSQCERIEKSNRFYSEKDKSIVSQKVHSKSACSEVAKIYKKHKNDIRKCNVAYQAISKDLYSDYSKVQDIQPFPGMGMGGFGGYGIGGGMGSSSSSPISGHVGICQSNYPSLFELKDLPSAYAPSNMGSGLSGGFGFGF